MEKERIPRLTAIILLLLTGVNAIVAGFCSSYRPMARSWV